MMVRPPPERLFFFFFFTGSRYFARCAGSLDVSCTSEYIGFDMPACESVAAPTAAKRSGDNDGTADNFWSGRYRLVVHRLKGHALCWRSRRHR